MESFPAIRVLVDKIADLRGFPERGINEAAIEPGSIDGHATFVGVSILEFADVSDISLPISCDLHDLFFETGIPGQGVSSTFRILCDKEQGSRVFFVGDLDSGKTAVAKEPFQGRDREMVHMIRHHEISGIGEQVGDDSIDFTSGPEKAAYLAEELLRTLDVFEREKRGDEIKEGVPFFPGPVRRPVSLGDKGLPETGVVVAYIEAEGNEILPGLTVYSPK